MQQRIILDQGMDIKQQRELFQSKFSAFIISLIILPLCQVPSTYIGIYKA